MRKLTLLLFISVSGFLMGIEHNYVPLTHTVYEVIESGEIKGILTDSLDTKPYSYGTVKEYLYILRDSDKLTGNELKVVNSYISEFELEGVLPQSLFIELESENRVKLESTDIHSYNIGTIGMRDTFYDILSYDINIGFTLDEVNTNAFAPYTFTKRYDGFHITSGEDKYSSGVDAFGFAFLALPQLNLSLFDDNLRMGLNRVRRNWGEGISSMILAGSGRPILGFDYSWRMNDHVTFSGLVGSLGNANGTGNNAEHYKNITSHYIEVKPSKYLELVLFDSAIWGKRNEVGYLFLMPTFLTQQIVGDVDNIAIGGTITGKLPGIGKAYFTLYIDEMENDEWDNFFHHNKNMYAFNTGFKSVIPKLPFGTLSFQYTKIEPYTYTHYVQEYPNFENAIDTSFTNDMENIAYNLPPNSDQFLVNISAKPVTGLTTTLNYSFIRHGDNEWKDEYYDPEHQLEEGEMIPVGGSMDKPLIYADHENRFAEKDFLNDGDYEFIHTITLDLDYTFIYRSLPLSAGLSYSYVIEESVENYNLFSLTLKTRL